MAGTTPAPKPAERLRWLRLAWNCPPACPFTPWRQGVRATAVRQVTNIQAQFRPREWIDMSFNILVVDDSKLARMVMASAFRRIRPDWTLVETSSAEEALSALS